MTMHLRFRNQRTQIDIQPKVYLWVLRLLIPLGGYRYKHLDFNDLMPKLIGQDADLRGVEQKDFLLLLRKLHRFCEQKLCNEPMPPFLGRNIARFQKLLALSETDCRILEFAVLLQSEEILNDVFTWMEDLPASKLFRVLSGVLNIPESEIRESLHSKAILAKSGLLCFSYCKHHASSALELLSRNFADRILSSDMDPARMLRDTFELSSPATLDMGDYEHMSSSVEALCSYLKHAVTSGQKGVNVFLYGDSGTGKSQLAKLLAKTLECELFEIASTDSDKDPINGDARLRALRAAQCILARRPAMILLDDVEDIISRKNIFFDSSQKGMMNRMLEENPLPTLWLSNSIRTADAAFIRRFDMVIELPVPPRKQRERILLEACSDFLAPSDVNRIAESNLLAPAMITRAASVVRLVRNELGSMRPVEAFELLMNGTLEAQGHRAIPRSNNERIPEIYDPRFIQSDANLIQVSEGLIQSKSGRLCLFGPPGTGKTAYGKWLAEQLNVPLMVKRASDLLSKYVGESEQNIAYAFSQAESDGALLLIDEVDSFLQNRSGAHNSWEISLVNEMLTQMESFQGVFIASTNLMEGLDPATLRRFDLKVKFDFLKPWQAIELLQRYCGMISLPPPEPGQVARIQRLQNLTPGDFAAVIRQHRFRPLISVNDLILALEQECVLTGGATASMGFIQ